ncbi:hypothetical protein Q9R20_00660 [Microbacterium sp. PRF11]|uniref:hypothetical protein n=1 Tax=Microbacterium sp. PRF11 TaxID=2962593 RepID=UPI00288255BF|nr:hypothetical protein [Microbacterium sp. PRF11]MDT0115481.1 hypothetical protein [Microbacterium sp. PRF11]
MPQIKRTLRLPPEIRTRVPVNVRSRAVGPVFIGAYALGGLAVFLAMVLGVPGVQLVMAAMGFTVAVAVTAAVMQFRHVKERRLLIDASAESLWFRPRASRAAWMVAAAASTIAPAAAMVYGLTNGLPGSASRSIVVGTSVLAVIGLVSLGRMLWSTRLPAGLALTELGIHGIRGAGDAQLMWEDIADVGIVAAPSAKLSITDTKGSPPVLAPMLYLGADANDVAVVLRFFRDHPEERSVLSKGGKAALQRVERVLSETAA